MPALQGHAYGAFLGTPLSQVLMWSWNENHCLNSLRWEKRQVTWPCLAVTPVSEQFCRMSETQTHFCLLTSRVQPLKTSVHFQNRWRAEGSSPRWLFGASLRTPSMFVRQVS